MENRSAARRRALAVLCLALAPLNAAATSDALVDLLAENGSAGLGVVWRVEQSLYRDGGWRYDLLPLYLYEGERFYLHAYRAGMKFDLGGGRRFDLFFSHRFEGFPYDRVPVSLAGMTGRDPGADFGLSYEQRFSWGNVFGEALHDISGVSRGGELRVGYTDRWTFGRWRLAPLLMVAARDAKLNDYYYGVSAEEAQPDRPEYHPRSGFNATAGLNLRYDLTERWRFVAGLSATRWASGVHHSPIVDNRPQFGGFGGFAYDFTPGPEMPRGDDAPLIIKLLHGGSTDCNMVPIMRLSCTSTSAADGTGVDAIEIGRPFIERANGWPLDFVGYAGALLHDENKLQPDFWQLNLYVKLFYYGFPWDNRVRTRVGFGAGISYARQVPFVEARDQADRGRNTSKLLSYLDPSIDVSLGDLMAVPEWRETYVGFGVSHRSGIFGMSSLLGNVNGGSNYIYTYIEWKM